MTKAEQKSFEPINGEAIAVRALTPLSVLQTAVDKGASVETLEKLLALQERFEAGEARKAFVAALAAFKANPPSLEKNKQVDFQGKTGGRVNYKYATLDYICSTIGASLSQHGLSFTWNVDQTGEGVKVTCVLRHEQGHSESVTMSAGLHDDTRMNSIQRLGATITYLERYSLLAATGLATADQDTDGMVMNNMEAMDLVNNIKDAADMNQLAQRYKEAVQGALRANDPQAVKVFMQARDKRQKELQAA